MGRGRGTYLALLVKPLGTNVGQRYAAKKNERHAKRDREDKGSRENEKQKIFNNGYELSHILKENEVCENQGLLIHK